MNRSCSEEKGEGRAHRIGYGTPRVRAVKGVGRTCNRPVPLRCNRESTRETPKARRSRRASSCNARPALLDLYRRALLLECDLDLLGLVAGNALLDRLRRRV